MTATVGEVGNRCQVDCANQGICDYRTGTCQCFDGQYGTDCSLQMEVPAKLYYSEDGVYGAPVSSTEGAPSGGDSGGDWGGDWGGAEDPGVFAP
jgi:hypothetical protein